MRTLIYLFKSQDKQARPLLYFGFSQFALALLFLMLLPFEHRQVLGINLWIKPLKFAVSIGIYCISWAKILPYLSHTKTKKYFIWFTIFAMAFEMLAISSQAARGQLSHFNQSGTYNIVVYALMGIVITAQTFFALYVGISFFKNQHIKIEVAMLWAIRFGIVISSVFALQGGFIGQRMAHTVGAPDGGPGLLFFNWNTTYGDLRIAHFFGLHALQILPAFVWLGKLRRPAPVVIFGVIYFILVSFLFYHALLGKGY